MKHGTKANMTYEEFKLAGKAILARNNFEDPNYPPLGTVVEYYGDGICLTSCARIKSATDTDDFIVIELDELDPVTKFKPGDKVRRVAPSANECIWGKVGSIYTIIACNKHGAVTLLELPSLYNADADAFELVTEPEVPQVTDKVPPKIGFMEMDKSTFLALFSAHLKDMHGIDQEVNSVSCNAGAKTMSVRFA